MREKSKRQPSYQAVADKLRQAIMDGTYPVGSLIPNEAQLETIYGVSRTTVRRAVSILAQENLLRVQQGYGTEVMANSPRRRFTDVVSFEEVFPFDASESQILQMEIEVVRVRSEDAQDLGLSADALVYRVQRIFGYQGEAYQIMINYIPMSLTPGLEEFCGQFDSLYPFLQEKYGLKYMSAIEEIRVRQVEFMEAQIFHLPAGAPVIEQKRIAQCTSGPMEIAYAAVRTDSYKFRVRMEAATSSAAPAF